MRNSVPVSVCMPMYNAAPYLRECIDSILSQSFEDFELLIVDDGSTDNSRDIVRSYEDKRIRLIENEHDYIGSLNMLLKEAKGKYIARMDADDVMMLNRLSIQFHYMETHPEVDILGAGLECFGISEGKYPPVHIGNVGYLELIEGCSIYHPTVLIRKERINEKGIKYRRPYIYAEDYGFWAEALQKGLHIRNIPDILLKYRLNEVQVSRTKSTLQREHSIKIKEKLSRIWFDIIEKQNKNVNAPIKESHKKLTIIIPFYNEGLELGHTLYSVRKTAGNLVDIIAINDKSNDSYDYEGMIAPYNVSYMENPHRLGPACTKEKGVQHCKTPYFLILDAHTRFYQSDWSDKIVEELESNKNQVLCCQTKPLRLIDGKIKEEHSAQTYGAFIYWGMKAYMPMSMWNPNPNIKTLRSDHIPCVLGACYASSKQYWNRVKGYQGLLGYGCEEPFISLKAWMEGGKCKLLKDIIVGHVYKDFSTHTLMNTTYIYNFIFIADLLLPTSLKCKVFSVSRYLDTSHYNSALILLKAAKNIQKELWLSLSDVLINKDFNYIKSINYVLHPEAEKDLDLKIATLPKILTKCQNESSFKDIGLYKGTTCLAILYSLYFRYTADMKWKIKAHTCLRKIFHYLTENKDYSFSFSNGLAGIGWALLYLADNGMVAYPVIEHYIKIIDKKISYLSPERIDDFSLDAGYTGIVAYITARLGFCKRHKEDCEISESLIYEAKKVSANYIECLTGKNDVYTYSIHLLMSEFCQHGWNTINIDFSDILSLPTYIPNNPQYWEVDLKSGYLGYAIHLLTTKYKTDENK